MNAAGSGSWSRACQQDRLHGLELVALAASAQERPASDATMKRLLTFARYGARIDKDIGRALQALRVLRDRPDAWIAEEQSTPQPEAATPPAQERTPTPAPLTPEPEPARAQAEICTFEPERPLNRHQRRALASMQRRQAA